MVVFADDEQQKRLDFLRKREEEELAQVLSGKYGVQYVDLSLVAVNVDALRVITEAEAKDAEAAAFGRVGKKISVAVRAPENPKVKILAAKLHDLGYDVTLYMCSKASLERAYQRYADLSYATETKAGVFELSNEELEQLLTKVTSLQDIGKLIPCLPELQCIEICLAHKIIRSLFALIVSQFLFFNLQIADIAESVFCCLQPVFCWFNSAIHPHRCHKMVKFILSAFRKFACLLKMLHCSFCFHLLESGICLFLYLIS